MLAWIVYGILVVATTLAFFFFIFQHCTILHIHLCFEVRSILSCSVTEKLEKLENTSGETGELQVRRTRREKLEKQREAPPQSRNQETRRSYRSWGGPLERGLAVKQGGPLVLG